MRSLPRHYLTLFLPVTVCALLTGAFWPRDPAPLPFEGEESRPAKAMTVPAGAAVATFAGGCFWGVEATFRAIPGVRDARAGYTGGTAPAPTYTTIHQDTTGHVEAVQVVYDPERVKYADLLQAFFTHHDPTLPRAGGQAIGKKYRSFIFTHTPAQEREARKIIQRLSGKQGYKSAPAPIVTRVQPATVFWLAEEYHQRYYAKRDAAVACEL